MVFFCHWLASYYGFLNTLARLVARFTLFNDSLTLVVYYFLWLALIQGFLINKARWSDWISIFNGSQHIWGCFLFWLAVINGFLLDLTKKIKIKKSDDFLSFLLFVNPFKHIVKMGMTAFVDDPNLSLFLISKSFADTIIINKELLDHLSPCPCICMT